MSPEKLQIIVELLKQGDGAGKASNELKQVETSAKQADRSLENFGSALKRLAVGIGLSLVIRDLIQTGISIESLRTVLTNATGSTQKADQEFKFLKDTANRLGAEFQRLAPAYAGIAAAAKNTSLEGEKTREIFLGVASAATANQLSAADLEGALRAVQQMMSKGVVAAEELRGQLGERIPRAFELAAESMGLTTQEFNKLLESGKVYAEDFLPKFAAHLIQEFGNAAQRGAHTLNGELNILKNNLLELKLFAGQGLSEAFRGLVVNANDVIGALNRSETALTGVSTAAKLAAFGIGTLGAQMLAVRGYAITTALFGAGWLTSAKDVAAAVALIGSSTVSLGVTIATALTGAVSVIYTLVKAFQTLRAQSEEAATEKHLLEFNADSRSRLEKEISNRVQAGTLEKAKAEELRQLMEQAFQAKERTISIPGTAIDHDTIKVRDYDSKAQAEALTRVRTTLDPGITTQPGAGGQDTAQKQRALTDEQKKAAEELMKLKRQLEVQTAQGFERERVQARQNFEARLEEINTLAKSSVATEDEILQLKSQNEEVFNNEIIRISNKRAEAEKKQAQEVQQFRDEETLASLTGYEREMKAAEINYLQRKRQIEELAARGMSATEETALNELNLAARVAEEKAAAKQREQENYRTATEQMRALETSLADEARFSSLNRVDLAQQEFTQRIALYDQLYQKGLLTEEQLRQATESAMLARSDAVRTIGLDVEQEYRRLTLSDFQLAADNFERRKQLVADYYDYEIERARDNADQVAQLEQQKTQHLDQLNQEKVKSSSQAANAVGQALNQALEMGARGVARQIVYMDQSWGQFAKNFLRSIAEMILETLILLALRLALKQIPGIGALLGGGGTVMAGEGGSNATLAAKGGMFSPFFAASGVMMAASGLDGVAEVSSPTLFPKFNVVAGEAGKEMLTVLAQPRMVDVNGVSAVVGKAGDRQLAIVDAAALNSPRFMADGGVAGGAPPLSRDPQRTGGMPNGELSIMVGLSPELQLQWTRNSIEGAVARVTQELSQDGKLSSAAKRLTR